MTGSEGIMALSPERSSHCPVCGAPAREGTVACALCGAVLSPAPTPPPPARVVQLSLPILRGTTWVSWILLGINVVIWLAMTFAGGSTDQKVLLAFGAKYGPAILGGEYWRLFSSSFLHIGVIHLAFNAYALYALGPEVERFFGRGRFLALYLLSGVLSSATSYLISSNLAAGASGSIFGLVGALGAFFVHERKVLGAPGRRRLNNLISVVIVNLVIGFTAPNIDNAAHVGGLIAGLAMGWVLSPRYAIVPPGPAGPAEVVDRNSLARSWWTIPAALVALLGLTLLGDVREGGTATGHLQRGESHLQDGEWEEAIEQFTAALAADPELWPAYLYRAEAYIQVGDRDAAWDDLDTVVKAQPDSQYLAVAHAGRGRLYMLRGRPSRALTELDRALQLSPQDPYARFVRGMIYYDMGEPVSAIDDLEAALDLGLEDERSLTLARQALEVLHAVRGSD
jgi:rhomboid protease GluP